MTTSRATSRPTAGGEPDFPAWLAGLPDDALVRVCELRPDVATPAPGLTGRARLAAAAAGVDSSCDGLSVVAGAAGPGHGRRVGR